MKKKKKKTSRKRAKRSKTIAPVPPPAPTSSAEPKPEPASDERSVLGVIRDVQSGVLSPENLSVRDRRLCVEHLSSEGYSVAEIAQVLKSTDRTISRDRAAIRQANAVEASPEFTGQMVGSLLKEADNTMSRIRRAARGADASAADKIESEKICWAIYRDLVHTLQRLGILYTAPQQIHGQMAHRIEETDSFGIAQLEAEIERMELVLNQATDMNASSPLFGQIVQVRKSVQQLAVQEQVQDLKQIVVSACNANGDGGSNNA